MTKFFFVYIFFLCHLQWLDLYCTTSLFSGWFVINESEHRFTGWFATQFTQLFDEGSGFSDKFLVAHSPKIFRCCSSFGLCQLYFEFHFKILLQNFPRCRVTITANGDESTTDGHHWHYPLPELLSAVHTLLKRIGGLMLSRVNLEQNLVKKVWIIE